MQRGSYSLQGHPAEFFPFFGVIQYRQDCVTKECGVILFNVDGGRSGCAA
jgi:hypothetical protein